MNRSPLHILRTDYQPAIPQSIDFPAKEISIQFELPISEESDLSQVFTYSKQTTPARLVPGKNPEATNQRNIGVLFSGGPAPGGHNVIWGLLDAMQEAHAQSSLYGFLGGASGLLHNQKILITQDSIKDYRNTGGFDLMGSGRTKIESPQQFATALKTCQDNQLDALVVIGGDDSNTNAALLAEYFLSQKSTIQVIGVPKTIDGDLRNKWIELSFGFDTATKVYRELIGNIARDAISSRKYWHFIKLMGRSASHIALECALQVHPNVCIISEEVQAKKQSLPSIVSDIAETVIQRQKKGQNFGVVLLPEGLIEFIPQMRDLIAQLNTLLAQNITPETLANHLDAESASLFHSLPANIRDQLLMDRDPHGNVQVSRIETEKLIATMVEQHLQERDVSFSAITHFLGYEGRAAFPSNFDADYCYALGRVSLLLIANQLTGCIAAIQGLDTASRHWQCAGIPIRSIVHMETRQGRPKPVIKKALVELDDPAFQHFAQQRQKWRLDTDYRFPGPIQYFGPPEVADQRPDILMLTSKEVPHD